MYEYMQSAGLQDLVMIPLQILPANAPKRGSGAQGGGPGVEYVEQQWMDRFWSLHWGYNTRMAHADPPAPFDIGGNAHCVGRLFGTRIRVPSYVTGQSAYMLCSAYLSDSLNGLRILHTYSSSATTAQPRLFRCILLSACPLLTFNVSTICPYHTWYEGACRMGG